MAETGTSRPPASGTDSGDFLELLGFCARAETLIAELLLLSDRAPPLFADRRFDPVLFDFRYPNLEQICELCRRHVPTPGTSASPGSSPFSSDIISIQKSEDLLRRFLLPEPVVNAVITCLRNGDVYNNIRFYPDPQHRTTALSLQGGHLGLAMREIVDRFFKDNWVVPIFLHFSVDLLVSWDAYKEAKSSLVSCLSPTSIRDISLHHYTKVPYFLAHLDIHMHAINKEYVLNNSQSLLSVIRECNFTLRWLLLHRMNNLAIEGLRRQQCDHFSRRDSDQRQEMLMPR
ncbi:unnamed protein product [Miscanthus lutarioriparius]|uniref:Uncharacterized protein n=1 Tax=Miscanthus lutarioriparius TaxID=422564 RepID=A0A811QHL5_9POAL|nr:unnamed protein product [Miscanthus lutarioriparius]